MLEMIQITPQSVLTQKHHEAVSTLSSMWCHRALGRVWISILVVLPNMLADRQHLGSSSAITGEEILIILTFYKLSLPRRSEPLGWSVFSLLERCPPVSLPPPGANNEMTVAAITSVP